MTRILEFLAGKDELRVVITDSGVGGLYICAELEKRLRGASRSCPLRLTYVNAWPYTYAGYNDLPDPASRARVLDRALGRMAAFRPGLLLIACNTLSLLYGTTEFSRAPSVPVMGIVEDGVDLFHERMTEDPGGSLVLFGTRTTIEAGEHIRRLVQRGIEGRRVFAAACHGLAAAFERDPDDPGLARMVGECVCQALQGKRIEGTLYAGLCCTHYSYLRDIFRISLGRQTDGRIEILDPGERLVRSLTDGLKDKAPEEPAGEITVEVVSKIELDETRRHAVARRLEPASARTARALIDYTHVPDLF
ncbi:MAG: aspartate/glutamate racemase family protein [Acidobacteria bacterium]|nr:aspartate/glutamate racemase family protein [Acidobacteriota bacterium]